MPVDSTRLVQARSSTSGVLPGLIVGVNCRNVDDRVVGFESRLKRKEIQCRDGGRDERESSS